MLTLDLLEHLGGLSCLHPVTADGQRLIAEARNMPSGRPGTKLGVAVEPDDAFLFDAASGRRAAIAACIQAIEAQPTAAGIGGRRNRGYFTAPAAMPWMM